MKRALLNHFLPPDHEELCYSAWYAVKQDGTLQDFHRRFLEALLKLPDITESAKLAHYYDVVDPDLVLGIKQRNPTTLHEAMHVAMIFERYKKPSAPAKPAAVSGGASGSGGFGNYRRFNSWNKLRHEGRPSTSGQPVSVNVTQLQTPAPPPAPIQFKICTGQENQEFLAKGLCFTCAGSDHVAKQCAYHEQYEKWVKERKAHRSPQAETSAAASTVDKGPPATSVCCLQRSLSATAQKFVPNTKEAVMRQLEKQQDVSRIQQQLEGSFKGKSITVKGMLGGKEVTILMDGVGQTVLMCECRSLEKPR